MLHLKKKKCLEKRKERTMVTKSKDIDKKVRENSMEDIEIFPKGEKIDISHLLFIYYRFPNKENVKVMYPKTVTAADDGHLVIDSHGGEHFIPSGQNGFIHIKSKQLDEDREKDILVEK